MPQNYKAVYFADYPAEDSKQKSLTLAFGKKSNEIFESIRDLTSEEIRQLLGTDNYQSIANAAVREDLPLNRYCIRQLKKSLTLFEEKRQQLTFSDITNDDILDRYNTDVCDPVFGYLVKIADNLSAFLESTQAIKNGCENPELQAARYTIAKYYENVGLGKLDVGLLFRELSS